MSIVAAATAKSIIPEASRVISLLDGEPVQTVFTSQNPGLGRIREMVEASGFDGTVHIYQQGKKVYARLVPHSGNRPRTFLVRN